jgi:transcriptional regulator with AAA-type ATPase domain/tetratricopeptide (TPR) repeat protein
MDHLAEILGRSPAIEEVRGQIRRLIARQRTGQRLPPVLLSGETGTGKGLVARLLHRSSPRASGPFDVNCAAIPETLLEAELFGYERGAFTDARQSKAGLFQTAHRGTLFLDEIGLLAEALQAKLLNVIEERAVRRLGGTRSEPFDVWLLCATNEDLAAAIRARRFREDLYHRIAVFTLRLPPLRERGEDVLLLAEEFLARATADYGLPPRTLAADAKARLLAHPWPGNIRELSNLMERASLLSEHPVITAQALSLPDRRPVLEAGAPAPAAPEETVRDELVATLERHRWNISRTAVALRVSRNTVRARIARFGLRRGEAPPRWKPAAAPARAQGVPVPLHPPAIRDAAAASAAAMTPAPAPATPIVRPASLRWERRQIALLRATLVTAEPEALLDTNRVLEMLLDKVRIFAGRVEEVSPTSIGAAFGLEDVEEAPRRAAHAAMAIQRALERGPIPDAPAFAARIGVHVAPLLVGHAGGPPEIDAEGKRAAWAAIDAVLDAVEPGVVALTAATAPLLDRRFALAPLSAAGRPAFRLLRPERTGLRAGRRMAAFVGRQQELDLLESRLAAATARSGQVIGIAGEAGIGKSRLLHEFRQRLRGRRVTWLEAHCVSYGGTMPYLPLLELLRRGCRLDDRDSPELIAQKVRHSLEVLGIEPDEAPYLLQFLGVKPGSEPRPVLTPEVIQTRTLNLVRRMAIQASGRRPLVVVIEDLHWVDAATTALASLLEGLHHAAVLVLLTYRPGYSLPWLDRSLMTQIALQPLTAVEGAAIASSIMEPTPDAAARAELIVRQAEGNPFFIEELARAVTAHASSSLPATVQQVVLSRINQLSDEARALIETAAVLGRQASLRLMDAMWRDAGPLDAALRELVRHEFLYPGSGAAGETVYSFKHALIQEVVYQNLLGGDRRRLHARAGAAIEALHAGREDEVIQLLAHHFAESDADEPAVDHAIRAGEQAIHRWATAEALAAFESALARLDRMPDSERNRLRRIDAVLRQSEVRLALGQHAEHLRALAGLREIVERSADPARRASWYYWMGYVHDFTGSNLGATIAYYRQAGAVAEQAELGDIRAFVDSCLAQAYLFQGDLIDALVTGERALVSFEAAGNSWWACRTLWHLIATSTFVGQWERGLAYSRRALIHADATGDRRLKIRTLYLTGSLHIQRGDIASGFSACESALALDPLPFDASMIRAIRGYGLVKSGDPAGGIVLLRAAVAWFAESRLRFSRAVTALRLAEGLLRAGDSLEAQTAATGVLDDAAAAGYRQLEGIALRLLGEAELTAARDRASSHLEAAIRMFESTGSRNELAKALAALADARAHAGHVDEARRLLQQALATFNTLETLDEPGRVQARLDRLESEPTA